VCREGIVHTNQSEKGKQEETSAMKRIAFISVIALLAGLSASAGTATFSGTANDTGGQMVGSWVSYQADGIACSLADTESGATTNLSTLLGSRSLADLGTITVILKEPNWFYGAWGGAWIEMSLNVGADQKIAFGFGPPWVFEPASQATWVKFGTQTETQRPSWNQAALGGEGHEPIGLRLASVGGNLVYSWSDDGWNWNVLQTWPINNLPGGLGDISTQPLSLEISEVCVCATICKFQWTAPSVTNLNGPGNTCFYGSCGDGKFFEMFAQFEADWPTFHAADLTGPDHNWDGISDPYQLAFLAAAMCKVPAVQAQYDANLVIANNLVTTNYWAWDPAPPANLANQIAAESMWDGAKMAINWYFWVYDPPAANMLAWPALAPDADFDGDGHTNIEEYNFAIAHGMSPQEFAAEATTPTTLSCPDWWFSMMFAQFEADWPTFHAADLTGPDHNWDGISDPYQLALVAAAMCKDPQVKVLYEANLDIAKDLVSSNYWGWDPAPPANLANQIAIEALWDSGKMAINWYFYVFDPEASQLQSYAPLTADGDFDNDTYTNKQEYDFMIARGATPAQFVKAATGGMAGPGMPVAGLLALAMLAGACGLGGVLSVRKGR
jgi:hypothetical protein